MSDVHNDDVKNLLDKNKIQHTEAVMYRTVSNDFAADEAFDYDMLVFFSPAGISALKKNFPDFDQKEIKIGTFGSTTAQAVRDAGLRLDLEAPSVQAPSMTAALTCLSRKIIKESKKSYELQVMSDLLIACRHNNGFIKLSYKWLCFYVATLVARFCIAPITYHS